MPALASLEAFRQAVADLRVGDHEVADLEVAAEPAARAEAERSVRESGFLLLGEVHGVRENPLIIRALLREFALTDLALEWPAELAPVISTFLAGDALADHPLLWFGDGRITAGYLAVLRELAAAGPLELTLLDGPVPGGVDGADWNWSQRDQAMVGRALRAAPAGTRTLVVAGGNCSMATRAWPCSRVGAPPGCSSRR